MDACDVILPYPHDQGACSIKSLTSGTNQGTYKRSMVDSRPQSHLTQTPQGEDLKHYLETSVGDISLRASG